MRTFVLTAMVALALAVPAFAQQNTAAQHPANTTTAADQKFVMDTAKGGIAEVELGKLAMEKAASAEVKQFAQRMVDDHGKANDELKTIAQSKNITLPTSVDPDQRALHDRLSKLSGQAFDRAYMQAMVADHRKGVSAFRTEAMSGKDPEFKAFASKTLPTLEDHMKMAEATSKTAAGTPAASKLSSPEHDKTGSDTTTGTDSKTPATSRPY